MNEQKETAAAIESIMAHQAEIVKDLETIKASADEEFLPAIEEMRKKQSEIIFDLEALNSENDNL